MTQAQHTPGPWQFRDGGIETLNYHPIARINDDPAFKVQMEANARLIAAAPELLEAAEQSLIHLEVMVLPYAKDKDEISSVKDVIEICKAAIAKARGQE